MISVGVERLAKEAKWWKKQASPSNEFLAALDEVSKKMKFVLNRLMFYCFFLTWFEKGFFAEPIGNSVVQWKCIVPGAPNVMKYFFIKFFSWWPTDSSFLDPLGKCKIRCHSSISRQLSFRASHWFFPKSYFWTFLSSKRQPCDGTDLS